MSLSAAFLQPTLISTFNYKAVIYATTTPYHRWQCG